MRGDEYSIVKWRIVLKIVRHFFGQLQAKNSIQKKLISFIDNEKWEDSMLNFRTTKIWKNNPVTLWL